MLKGQKGITLVALVITIIVLLILAGVSISLVVGDSSILGNASKAAKDTNVSKVKETVELALASMQSNFLVAQTSNPSASIDTYFTKTNLNTELGKLVSGMTTADGAAILSSGTGDITVSYNSKNYTVTLTKGTNGYTVTTVE